MFLLEFCKCWCWLSDCVILKERHARCQSILLVCCWYVVGVFLFVLFKEDSKGVAEFNREWWLASNPTHTHNASGESGTVAALMLRSFCSAGCWNTSQLNIAQAKVRPARKTIKSITEASGVAIDNILRQHGWAENSVTNHSPQLLSAHSTVALRNSGWLASARQRFYSVARTAQRTSPSLAMSANQPISPNENTEPDWTFCLSAHRSLLKCDEMNCKSC
jgi:hypothetical protein